MQSVVTVICERQWAAMMVRSSLVIWLKCWLPGRGGEKLKDGYTIVCMVEYLDVYGG